MGDLSTHFSSSEFQCKCCGKIKNDKQLIIKLEQLRAALGNKPIIITSGYRCPEYSVKVGGYANDAHTVGIAADIMVSGLSVEDIAEEAEKTGFTGIGLMNNAVHVDIRNSSNYHNSHWFGDERTGENIDTFIRKKNHEIKVLLDGKEILSYKIE